MSDKILFRGQKIETDISGLDDLLFGGLYLKCPNVQAGINKPLEIAVYGDKGTSRALFAMQLLHGITKSVSKYRFKSLKNVDIRLVPPVFYTDNKGEDNLSDMLLDMLISKCIGRIVESNAKGHATWTGSLFCNTIFDTDNVILNVPIDRDRLDKYVSEEILVYNTHTNSLHVAQAANRHEKKKIESTPVFTRKTNSINEYVKCFSKAWNNKDNELADDFFNVNFWKEGEMNRDRFDPDGTLSENEAIPCLVIDKISNSKDYVLRLDYLKEHSFVVISIFDEIPDASCSFDMMIELRRKEDEESKYVFNQLSINKSTMQDTAIGWHIFKKRDYGIEIYPSSHVLLQKRRHMPKGILLSQRSILSQTYQRFIDGNTSKHGNNPITDFEGKQVNGRFEKEALIDLYQQFNIGRKKECPADILRNILIPSRSSEPKGESTAIIGSPNTFKRFLTLSSTFNAGSHDKHTLNILLDKEDSMMFKRMLCPAYINKKSRNAVSFLENHCLECYKCIHFSNMRMGCISSDEFFYYLIKQINISRESEHQITRIVIDDLQKLEFCFPVLHSDKLFLTTLISICKDFMIDLFMLCDKNSPLVPALRAQTDNLICTERVGDNELSIYIERYAGYSTPSKIWKCNVTSVLELFYCDVENEERKNFKMSERHITNESLMSMEHYWNDKEEGYGKK